MKAFGSILFAALMTAILSGPVHGVEPLRHISGWILPETGLSAPPSWLGDDPVVGRLSCPPLTRLNLKQGENEPVLLARVAGDRPGVTEWQFELRSGLHWWSGDFVVAEHLETFLRQNLEVILAEKSLGTVKIPSHQFSVSGARTVTLKWQDPPTFGPWILSGQPFWRKVPSRRADGQAEIRPTAANQESWECAGLFALQPGKKLAPTAGYRPVRPEIQLTEAGRRSQPGPSSVNFLLPDSLVDSPTLKRANRASQCQNLIDLPFVSVISWNTRAGLMTSPELRQTMTKLTPRGELLRAGAAAWGELLSGPIPRSHPGYNPSVKVRPYSVEQSSAALARLGFRREQADGPRLGPNGQPMKITLLSVGASSSLLDKVIADSYALVGIKVDFKHIDAKEIANGTWNTADGVVTVLRMGLPGSDLLANFHSNAKPEFPFFGLQNRQLDALLESYNRSLSWQKPDFAALRSVHTKLFDLEPLTILFQHKACIDSPSRITGRTRIDDRDPDWFRRIAL